MHAFEDHNELTHYLIFFCWSYYIIQKMDERFRKQRVDFFLIRLKLPFGIKLKPHFDELGVQSVEHLKHLEKENWDFVNIEILELELIQIRQLKTAIDFLKRSVEIFFS